MEADFLVVGGGLLGMSTAVMAAREKRRVLVCRRSDKITPHADTLRNQSWLQSGLRYLIDSNHPLDIALARRMVESRQSLFRAVGLWAPWPGDKTAIIRVATENDGAKLVKDALVTLRLPGVNQVDPREIADDLGPFYERSGFYYTFPDVVFDQPALLDLLRIQLESLGGRVCEVDALDLVRDDNRVPPFRLKIRSKELTPPSMTILAAGAANLQLLRPFNVDQNFVWFRTPLFVLPKTLMGNVRIFFDTVRRFAVVNHPRSARVREGATVISAVGGHRVAFPPSPERKVTRDDCERIRTKLQHFLPDLEKIGRFTAGFELADSETLKTTKPPKHATAQPCVRTICDGLIAAYPGRAGLSMSVANSEIRDEVRRHKNRGSVRTPPLSLSEPDWRDPIHMHQDDYYASLDDAEDASTASST